MISSFKKKIALTFFGFFGLGLLGAVYMQEYLSFFIPNYFTDSSMDGQLAQGSYCDVTNISQAELFQNQDYDKETAIFGGCGGAF